MNDAELEYLVFGNVWSTGGFSGGSDGKESVCQCRRPGFDPWVRKIPWRRKWHPTPVLLSGEFHGQRSPEGYNPWDSKEWDTTEQLTFTFRDYFN